MTESNESTFIGIDLGGSSLKGALVDNAGEILQEIRQETEHESSSALVKQLAEAVRSLRADRRAQQTGAIGIGIPRSCQPEDKPRRADAEPSPRSAEIDITAELAREAGLPVILDNDANSAAYGELQAVAARGRQRRVFRDAWNGIGSGFIINGRLPRRGGFCRRVWAHDN